MNFLIPNVRDYVSQFVDFPLPPGPISPEDVKWHSEQIKVTLTSSVKSGDKDWNGPANFYSLILGIEAHLGWTDISTETLSISGLGNPLTEDRMLAKAQNIKVSLENTDRTGSLSYFTNKRLSSFVKGIVWFPIPIIVPRAEAMKVSVAYVDEAADMVSGSTDVGLDLWALQVRCGK